MMSSRMTFEQVEQQVVQWPPRKQLELVARIGGWLSPLTPVETNEKRPPHEYAAQVEAFLSMSDDMAAETVGEVDSAEDIRQIREERMTHL